MLCERTADNPFDYCFGKAQIFPALERALVGMRAGERREVQLAAADAYGENASEEVAFSVPLDVFPPNVTVAVGDSFWMADDVLDDKAVWVHRVTPTRAYVGLTHPWAGRNVRIEVEVLRVEGERAASDDVIASDELEGSVDDPNAIAVDASSRAAASLSENVELQEDGSDSSAGHDGATSSMDKPQ